MGRAPFCECARQRRFLMECDFEIPADMILRRFYGAA